MAAEFRVASTFWKGYKQKYAKNTVYGPPNPKILSYPLQKKFVNFLLYTSDIIVLKYYQNQQ